MEIIINEEILEVVAKRRGWKEPVADIDPTSEAFVKGMIYEYIKNEYEASLVDEAKENARIAAIAQSDQDTVDFDDEIGVIKIKPSGVADIIE